MDRILLVGINKYQLPGNDLQGCINDIDNVQALLANAGVPAENFRRLEDESATTQNVRDEILRLVNDAEERDIVYFHYSGHGSQKADRNNDEPDALDEMVCPHDVSWGDSAITDDWLGEQFRILRNICLVIVTLDCCHSGTGLRAFGVKEEQKRFIPPPIEVLEEVAIRLKQKEGVDLPIDDGMAFAKKLTKRILRKEKGFLRWRSLTKSLSSLCSCGGSGGNPGGSGEPLEGQRGVVLLTGCKANQTSADARIHGVWQGAFTAYLLQAIRVAKQTIVRPSFTMIIDETRILLKNAGYSQIPQIEEDYVGRQWPF